MVHLARWMPLRTTATTLCAWRCDCSLANQLEPTSQCYHRVLCALPHGRNRELAIVAVHAKMSTVWCVCVCVCVCV